MIAYDIKIRRGAFMPTLLPVLFWGFLGMGQAGAEEAVEGPRWYQVELVVFAHNTEEALDSERWPEIAGVSLPENLRRLSLPVTPASATPPPPAVTPEPFQILGDEELQLKDVAAKVVRSTRFKPLLHVAWRQPTLADELTQPILLHDGMTTPYTEAELAALQAQTGEDMASPVPTPAAPTILPQDAPAPEESAETGPLPHTLLGTVRLSVARYLHLDADLLYRIPVTQKAAVPVPDLDLWYDRPYPTLRDPQGPAYVLEEWQAVRGFRLAESRRMRSKEIHYLDHPFFGVVVLVTPLEKQD